MTSVTNTNTRTTTMIQYYFGVVLIKFHQWSIVSMNCVLAIPHNGHPIPPVVHTGKEHML